MIRTISVAISLTCATIGAIAAEQPDVVYTITDANGALVDELGHIRDVGDNSAFGFRNIPALLFVSRTTRMEDGYQALVVMDDPGAAPCAQGPFTGPDGVSYATWSQAIFSISPDTTKIRFDSRNCGEGPIETFYGEKQ